MRLVCLVLISTQRSLMHSGALEFAGATLSLLAMPAARVFTSGKLHLHALRGTILPMFSGTE
mgnify:CR=1 FL=1